MAQDLKWAIEQCLEKPIFFLRSKNPDFTCNLTMSLLISLPSFAWYNFLKKPRILNYLLQKWFGHSQQRQAEQDGNLAFLALFILLLGVFEQLHRQTEKLTTGKTSWNALHSVFRRKILLQFQRQIKISTESLAYLAEVQIRKFYIRSKPHK